jgi:hypothetical protein
MKKLLATVTAVALSLAMVAMPSVAMADEVESTDTVTTETVTTETTAPEPVVTEPVVTEPTEVTTTQGELAVTRANIQTTSKPEDLLCTDITGGLGYEAKVDVGLDDPVSVTIPSGFTLVAYCVKAGTEPIIIDSNDDAPGDGTLPFVGPGQFVIDHPNKDSVSHYQLKLIATVDVCDNIADAQTSIPEGMELAENGTSCVLIEDDCDELTGARGLSISVDEECPDLELEVSGTPTHQVCEASGDDSVGTLVQGSIQLTVSDLDGVTKIEYSKDGGSVTEVDLGGSLLIENLAPGKYDFVVTVADGYESVDDFSVTVKADNDPECKKQTICHWNEGGKGELGSYVEIDVSIKSIINVPNGHKFHENDIIPPFDYYDDEDNLVSFPGLNFDPQAEGCDDYDLPTEGPVIPEVVFTPGTCDTDGSYTLIAPPLTEGVPADVVTFFVNDVETAPGTYPVAVGEVITVKVVANYPADFPLDIGGSFFPEYTYPAYEFTAPTACDLTTLALTGSGDTTPALALTAFLGLLGLAMVRSGIRVNRTRQEA